MAASRSAMIVGLAAALLIPRSAAGQDPTVRGRILHALLSHVVCCSTDIQFTKPADARNIPDNLGLAIAPGPANDGVIQIGQIRRGNDGKPALQQAYTLDPSCRPVRVQGVPLRPFASFFTVAEIGSLKPKNALEELWPVVNASFQSTLLGAMKLPSPTGRHTCLRQHLERVIHGEEGALR
jgi:hypothetical protein